MVLVPNSLNINENYSEAGERWARLDQARAASRPGLCACPPRAHQSSLTLSINTSLSWCCWGAGSGCIPGRLAAPELCACSQASSPLGFCPCTASGLSSFLSDYFLYWEAPFRGLDPLNVGPGSIPGLGRSPGGGHGNPLQYSCLETPHGQSLAGYRPRVVKSQA